MKGILFLILLFGSVCIVKGQDSARIQQRQNAIDQFGNNIRFHFEKASQDEIDKYDRLNLKRKVDGIADLSQEENNFLNRKEIVFYAYSAAAQNVFGSKTEQSGRRENSSSYVSIYEKLSRPTFNLVGPSKYDSRVDIRDLNPLDDTQHKMLTNARSVGLIINKTDLVKVSDTVYSIASHQSLGQRFNLCTSEPFSKQIIVGEGTGFITGHNCITTAGHVLGGKLKDHVIIFGFEALNKDGGVSKYISASGIYGFKSGAFVDNELDVAVVYLDRPCDLPSLKIENKGQVKDQAVYMIGHPSGLPKKIAFNAEIIKNNDKHYFFTSLDAFQGNSGSPVFDKTAHSVIGILVSGNIDYVPKGGCNVSKLCKAPFCDGEKVLRIQTINNLHDRK